MWFEHDGFDQRSNGLHGARAALLTLQREAQVPDLLALELFNALGESIGVVTVPEDAVEPLRADEGPLGPSAVSGGVSLRR
jgi:hypothetical protein